MIPRIFITLIPLWVSVMPFNLPCCWDPSSQTWKMNHDPNEPNIVWVMPPELAQLKSNSPSYRSPDPTHMDKCNENWQIGSESSQLMSNSPSCQSLLTTCKKKCKQTEKMQQLTCSSCCDCCNNGEDQIIIDTDGDAADAMAISMILNCTRNKSAFTVAGITCTWGSTNIRNVVKNVVKTLKACNRFCEIPVYAGSDCGLVEAKGEKSEYGSDAFGDFYYYPDVDEDVDDDVYREHPAIFMANLVRQNPGKVKIVCMGPMVNIVLAAHIHSGFYKDVKEILYLGGSMMASGKHKGVSWNDLLDPYASKAVFNKEAEADTDGPKITICIDECHINTYFPWEWRKELGAKKTSVMNLLNFAERAKFDTMQIEGWNCDSPFLAAVLLDRRIFSEVAGRCSVDTPSGEMKIETDDENPNVRVIQKADVTKLKKLMSNCLG